MRAMHRTARLLPNIVFRGSFLRDLRPSPWIARQSGCAVLPRHLFAGEADYDQLREMLARY